MKFTAREDFLPYARPDIGQAEIDKVAEVIRSGWLTTGPIRLTTRKSILEAYGGWIKVESEGKLRGTLITIYLPSRIPENT